MYRKLFKTYPVEGGWDNQKAMLKQKYSSLTDQDLQFETGKMDKMFEKLKVRLGKSKEEMHRIIEHFNHILS